MYQVEPLVKIGCINNGEDAVRRLRALHPTKDDVDSNLLFERMRTQAMSAWQIDQLHRLAIELQLADMPFDGYAWVITDALPQAGQSIEERTFSAIGVADNRNAGIRLPASWYVVD